MDIHELILPEIIEGLLKAGASKENLANLSYIPNREWTHMHTIDDILHFLRNEMAHSTKASR